jgi:hypothetical protein
MHHSAEWDFISKVLLFNIQNYYGYPNSSALASKNKESGPVAIPEACRQPGTSKFNTTKNIDT